MNFSSPAFLLLFLPVVLLLHFATPRRLRNWLLVLASLAFYAWGETVFVLVMLLSIAVNYGLGRWIDGARGQPGQKMAMAIGIVFNVGLLAAFKYTRFLWQNLDALVVALGGASLPPLQPIHLPIGISFFTFQALSYVVDIYRDDAPVQKSPLRFALFISLFPQLIAGPIVRYRQIAPQLARRAIKRADFAYGAKRFIVGLAKKTLLADTLAVLSDNVFAIPVGEMTPWLAWIGAIAFTLQIYFDFSGYSDMAIGVSRMFGFRLPENFLYPYVSRSMTEFWKRWHISLSTWLRDYLYRGLGANRKGARRGYVNLLFVFVICGLWHGAAWHFAAWGALHGAFLALERMGLQTQIERLPRLLQHVYAMGIMVVSITMFRAQSLADAAVMSGKMFGLCGSGDAALHNWGVHGDPEKATALLLGVVCSLPWVPWFVKKFSRWVHATPSATSRELAVAVAIRAAVIVVLAAMFTLSAMQIAGTTLNPFVYFRF